MIKKHKRTISGGMRRTSRIFLTTANAGKVRALTAFLHQQANVIRYFAEMFWSTQDLSANLAEKVVTDRAVRRFGITARLAQMAAKQAKELVRSQQEREKKRLPRLRRVSVNIDSRGVTIEQGRRSFDVALRFGSGVPSVTVLLNHTKHSRKFLADGWTLSKSLRMGLKQGKVWIDLIFEKPKPALRETGDILGIDLGYRYVATTSRGERFGADVKTAIERAGKRRKRFHQYIATEIYRTLKQIDLTGVQVVALENLKYVKHNKRGTFSRRSNRLLSFWHYTRALHWLRQRCEHFGVRVEMKDPWKTSQRCVQCGNIDKRSRKGEQFQCVACGFMIHADENGARNLQHLAAMGKYSFHSDKPVS